MNRDYVLPFTPDLEDIRCNVSCPPLYSSVNNRCTVTWLKPVSASCDAILGYVVTVTRNDLAVDSPLLGTNSTLFATGVLEPNESYTASVRATSTCGSTQPILSPFVTPKEES